MKRLNIAAPAALAFVFTWSMAIGCASSSKGVTTQAATKAKKNIPISTLTPAPRRVTTTTKLDKPLPEVWAYLSDHQNLLEYADGVLGTVSVDGSSANSPHGVGTKRQCVTADGKDKFVETIVHFEAPYVFAYSATENTWGLQEHLATVTLTPTDDGGTRVQWDQYFNHVQPDMAPMVAKNIEGMLRGKILPYLTKKFGGSIVPAS